MNFLAHAFLSFDDTPVLTGNMISDFVKGKKQYDFPQEIHAGIRLHRLIDEFTDVHPVTHEAKKIFSPDYRLYSGPIIDVIYDHFLAVDGYQFEAQGGLKSFTAGVYSQLDRMQEYFPATFGAMYPYMRAQNWLYNYKCREGIQSSLRGLARRARYMKDPGIAFGLFNTHYEELKSFYSQFFPALKLFTHNHFAQLIAK